MSSVIPVKNVYYLLCYAWNSLEEGKLVDVGAVGSTELVDLFAAVLTNGCNHLFRRGLDQGYLEYAEEIAGIRGRVDVAVTARRMLPQHGKAYCQFDELSVDTLPNQILKATIRQLLMVYDLDAGVRKKLLQTYRQLSAVGDVKLTKALFRRVQLHSNNRFYRFLLRVCELVVDSLILDESAGANRFRDFLRDDKKMASLFEAFVLNFLKAERKDLAIKRERIYWLAESESDPDLTYLPTMETDISVRSSARTLIIDTKYYGDTFQRYYDRKKIHSSNLYQVFAYLKNLEHRNGPDATADGMLLYPVVSEGVRLKYQLGAHRIRICTLDLSKDWKDIRAELLELVDGL